jgi:predicted permease
MVIDGWLHRLRVLVAPEAYAREVEAEIRFHLELEAMHARGESASEIEALWAARRKFGNVTHVREEVRRMSGMEWIDRIRQDLSYAVRGLRKSPGFTAAVVLTLGLGLGVNAAMFTFLDQVFVKPPASVADPGTVRRLYADFSRRDEAGRYVGAIFRYPQIKEIARTTDSGIAIGVFTNYRDTVSLVAGPRLVVARRALTNAAYFRILGVHPRLGRFFDAIEDRVETPTPVAVISHDLWHRAFNDDPAAVGSTVMLRDRPITIIGIAAEGFTGIELDRTDMWMPINYTTKAPTSPPWYEDSRANFALLTRLPTPATERRFLDVATGAVRSVHMPGLTYDSTTAVRAGPILSALGPTERNKDLSVSLRLGGVALIVLLIAVANVSNLLLVRATRRGREIAVRRALGVSRGRLFEQLFTESVLLAGIAGVASIILALWAGAGLRKLLLPNVHWADGPLDVRATIFAAITTLLVGVLVGLAPAVHAWRSDVVTSLKAGSRNAAYRRSGLRAGLLVAQAALSVVLLVGAGLFVRSLRNLQAIDIGYDIDRTVIVSAASPRPGLAAALDLAMPDLLQRLRSIDGVEATASANTEPMLSYAAQLLFLPNRDSLPEVGGERGASFVNVSADYFRTTGIRVVAGHIFSENDRSGVVVSEGMAKSYWPNEPALTKCLILRVKDSPCTPVVGVVEDVHRMAVIEPQTQAQYYVSTPNPRSVILLRIAPRDQARVLAFAIG